MTLFALALDPFFQQVVEYPEHWRIQEGTGSIPTATSYQPYLSGQEYRQGFENIELDPNMMAVSHHFFYDNGTLPITFGKGVRAEVPLVCPNSKCTWPEYETLGICNECTDASDVLEFKCINTTLDWVQAPGTDPETEQVTFSNGTSCGWYLKADNPLLMTGYNVDRDTAYAGEILMMRAQPIYDIFTREPLPGYTVKLNNSRNPLAHAIIVSGESLDNIQRNATPIAHECLLSWCVKTMMSEYTEGGYTENVTRTFTNDTVGPSPWVTEQILDDEGAFSGTFYYYLENVTVRGHSGYEYHVDNTTHSLTLFMFDDTFPSSYTLANSSDPHDAMLRYKEYTTVRPFSRNLTYNPYMYDNISAHLDKLATAMTNQMRSATSNTELIIGPAFDKESFVDVRWAWLTLPLGLLGLAFIFLVATVIRSSFEQEHVGVWKTSAIATLLYGLPDEMQKKITSSKEHGTPRAKAKEVRVKWLPRGGWRFSGNATSPTAPKTHKNMPPEGWI